MFEARRRNECSNPGLEVAIQTRKCSSKRLRSFRRHATLLEKCRRRMGLESRVASRRDISPSLGCVRSQQHQERRSRPRRKAASLARPTSRRMAKARRPRPRRSLRGRFALMLCASSTAASQNLKHQCRVLTLPFCRPQRAIRLRFNPSPQKGPPTMSEGLFTLLAMGEKWAAYGTRKHQVREDDPSSRYNVADMITIAVTLKQAGPDGTSMFNVQIEESQL
jgi:hypothetical protein